MNASDGVACAYFLQDVEDSACRIVNENILKFSDANNRQRRADALSLRSATRVRTLNSARQIVWFIADQHKPAPWPLSRLALAKWFSRKNKNCVISGVSRMTAIIRLRIEPEYSIARAVFAEIKEKYPEIQERTIGDDK